MKQLYIISALLLLSNWAYSQSLDEAVKFSRTSNLGSARSAAMGGAFGALGGDISSLNTNPAGVGVFRKSEIAFTPSLNFSHIESGHGSISKNSFQVGQLGAVFSFYSPNFDWKGINFGINYTNLNNFNKKTDRLIDYSTTSITNVWAFDSYGLSPDSPDMYLESALAYKTKLIYLPPGDENNDYFSILEVEDQNSNIFNAPVAQWQTTKEEGYQGEYSFSFGTNYKDKLYLGMSIGIQSLYYKYKSSYTEYADESLSLYLDAFQYYKHIKINGVGTNLTFGVIYRPIPELRIGASIHTPTWYNLNYNYSAGIGAVYWATDSEIGLLNDYYSFTGDYSFDYSMRTPWRATVSLATVLQQRFILSADYEYIDYTNANYSDADDGADYYMLNQDMKDLLRSTHNIRLGTEYRFNSIFSLRAGYNFQASPYKNDKKNNQIHAITAGMGLNFGVFYCDAAYIHKYTKDVTYFYSGVNPFYNEVFTSLPVTNKYYDNEARLTLGVRF